jgi:katanin p60 ATPase-containing subunit A1
MARFYSPTTIFIDEVDAIGSKRGDGEHEASRRVKAELLVQMDGVSSFSSSSANEETEEEKRKLVMVLGATNHPWDLDDALRRRFEKRVCKNIFKYYVDIPLPNEKGREEMFKINIKGVSIKDDVDWKELVSLTDGYSGADIANVCREAALMQMRRRLLMNKGGDILELLNNPNLQSELEAPISREDFISAINNISKSVSFKDLEKYETWTKEFKSN